jgi:hypothetical protein
VSREKGHDDLEKCYLLIKKSPGLFIESNRITDFSSMEESLLLFYLDDSSAGAALQIYNPSVGPERMERRSDKFLFAASAGVPP